MRYQHRIIVEGMDGTGKTTLVEGLIRRHSNFFSIPPFGPGKDWEKVLPETLDVQDDGRVPVHDRFFFSEVVYGLVLRHKVDLTPELLNNVGWFLRSTAFLVYARPTVTFIRDAVKQTQQMDGVAEQFTELIETYDRLMVVEKEWFGDRFFQYDWSRPNELARLEAQLEGYLGT